MTQDSPPNSTAKVDFGTKLPPSTMIRFMLSEDLPIGTPIHITVPSQQLGDASQDKTFSERLVLLHVSILTDSPITAIKSLFNSLFIETERHLYGCQVEEPLVIAGTIIATIANGLNHYSSWGDLAEQVTIALNAVHAIDAEDYAKWKQFQKTLITPDSFAPMTTNRGNVIVKLTNDDKCIVELDGNPISPELQLGKALMRWLKSEGLYRPSYWYIVGANNPIEDGVFMHCALYLPSSHLNVFGAQRRSGVWYDVHDEVVDVGFVLRYQY